jgi:hypothetical protein
VSRDWGAEGPTFDEVLAQIRQEWQDVGNVIASVQRALGEVRSIHDATQRSGSESVGHAEAA